MVSKSEVRSHTAGTDSFLSPCLRCRLDEFSEINTSSGFFGHLSLYWFLHSFFLLAGEKLRLAYSPTSWSGFGLIVSPTNYYKLQIGTRKSFIPGHPLLHLALLSAPHSFQITTTVRIWSKRWPTLWLQPSASTTRCGQWTIWTPTSVSSWKRSRGISIWRSCCQASRIPSPSG